MDTLQGRDVAMCDLPGYFLQTDTKGDIVLCIDRALTLLLVKLNQKHWKKYLRYRWKTPVIHVSCDKAIYSTVAAALLSYNKLVGHPDWTSTNELEIQIEPIWTLLAGRSKMMIYHGIMEGYDNSNINVFTRWYLVVATSRKLPELLPESSKMVACCRTS